MHTEPEFFVAGLPRSGTTWLGGIVAEMNPSILVNHEAIHSDFRLDEFAVFEPWIAREYVTGERQEKIDARMVMKGKERYGEITPRSRYFIDSIVEHYPRARFVHLVRDPRKAVVSLMNYGYYGPVGRPHRTVAPDGGKWEKHRRASWAWAYGHHRIRMSVPDFVRLEDLVSDFGAFAAFCDQIGVECDRAVWEKQRAKPKNPSTHFTTAPFEKWPPSWQKALTETTNEEARRYGYA